MAVVGVGVTMRRLGVGLAAWGLVAACHPAAPTRVEEATLEGAPVEPAPTSPSSSEPAAMSEAVPAPSPSPEPPPVTPPLPAPATTEERAPAIATPSIKPLARSRFLSARDVAVFNDVCQLVDGKEAAGCTCCPLSDWCPETKFPPLASIQHVFHGAFSAPGKKEVFAAGTSVVCGNLAGWGATWFLRHDGTTWQPVRGETHAHEVLHGTTWKKDDGTRGLVVHDLIGKGFYGAIAWMTFADDGAATREELLSWSNSDCMRRMPGYYAAAVDYVGANRLDHDKDGHRDVVISLDVRRRFVDDAFQKECSRWYDDTRKPGPLARMKAQRVSVPLLFDGAAFTPEAKAFARFSTLVAEVDKSGKPAP